MLGIAMRSNKGKQEVLTERYLYVCLEGKSILEHRTAAIVGSVINFKLMVNFEAQEKEAHDFGIYEHAGRAKPFRCIL